MPVPLANPRCCHCAPCSIGTPSFYTRVPHFDFFLEGLDAATAPKPSKPQPAVDKWVIRMPNGTPLYKTAVPLLCYLAVVELTQGGEAGERAFIGVQRSTEMHVARALPHSTYSYSAFICLMSEAIKGR